MFQQITVDECIAVVAADLNEACRREQILTLALTADPVSSCVLGSCPCWADCEIAGACLERDE